MNLNTLRTTLTTLVLIAMLAGPAWAAPAPTAYNVSWWVYQPCCLPGQDCDPTDPAFLDAGVSSGLGLGVFTERDDGLQELRISAVGGSPNNPPEFGAEIVVTQGLESSAEFFLIPCGESVAPAEIHWTSSRFRNGERVRLTFDSGFQSGSDVSEVHLVGTKTYVGADIKTPSGSAAVSGTTSVKIAATGAPPGVPLVYRLATEGRQIGVVTSTTLDAEIGWYTPGVTNGAHLLEATVADRSGTVLATDVQTVTVTNALAVFITNPKLSATVSGTVAVNVWLEGAASGPNTYTIAVDGKTIATQTCACVHVWPGWNTALLANGAHTLTATVRDATGRTGTARITVLTAN